MPAFNAEKLLARTIADLDTSIIDDVILVDNASCDHTVDIARSLGVYVWQHPVNRGFGGNLKQGYRLALQRGADIIATVHPDYQYEPKLVPAMAHLLLTDNYDCVLGCRMTCNGARRGHMPTIRFYGNKVLSACINGLTWAGITEYHTGYRCYTRQVLESLPLAENSDDFVFDIQIILQALAFGYRFGEISCPTRYMDDASSISHLKSLKASVELAYHTLLYRAHQMRVWRRHRLFSESGQKLLDLAEDQMVGYAVEYDEPSRKEPVAVSV
ncbi:glycosyltransferase family 2 protein [Candidatus Entotheonella palauensis]